MSTQTTFSWIEITLQVAMYRVEITRRNVRHSVQNVIQRTDRDRRGKIEKRKRVHRAHVSRVIFTCASRDTFKENIVSYVCLLNPDIRKQFFDIFVLSTRFRSKL